MFQRGEVTNQLHDLVFFARRMAADESAEKTVLCGQIQLHATLAQPSMRDGPADFPLDLLQDGAVRNVHEVPD